MKKSMLVLAFLFAFAQVAVAANEELRGELSGNLLQSQRSMGGVLELVSGPRSAQACFSLSVRTENVVVGLDEMDLRMDYSQLASSAPDLFKELTSELEAIFGGKAAFAVALQQLKETKKTVRSIDCQTNNDQVKLRRLALAALKAQVQLHAMIGTEKSLVLESVTLMVQQGFLKKEEAASLGL